jgi:hypothetical protein
VSRSRGQGNADTLAFAYGGRLVGGERGREGEAPISSAHSHCRAEPVDFARAVSAGLIARTAYDRLLDGRKREHVRAIKSAIKPDTRIRRIEKALATLRELESAGSAADHGRTRPL